MQQQATLMLHVMVVAFVAVVFVYFGSSFAHTGRYLLPLVPFAALAAAYGLVSLGAGRWSAAAAAAW